MTDSDRSLPSDQPTPRAPDRRSRHRDGDPHADLDRVRAALQAYSTEFLLLLNTRGELVAANTEYPALGYGRDERTGRHIAEHLHPDDLPKVFDLIERARSTSGFEERIRVRVRSAYGDWGVYEATVIDAMHNPELRGAVLRVRDVTREVEQEARDREDAAQQDRFLSLAEALPLGILSADARGYVVFCNEAAQQILNLPEDQLLGHGWESAVHHEDLLDVASGVGQVLVTGVPHQVTFRVQTGLFPRWAHAKFVPLGHGPKRSGWIATFEDITDRRRAESRLAFQATHDALTNLPNRTLLDDRLHQACGRLRRGSESVTVVFIDLDRFKEINDSFGHAAGDRVLVEVAGRLRKVIRDVDTVARLGGDEFVVVCENLPPGDEPVLLERIEQALEVPLLVAGQQVTVGASIGSAFTDDPLVEPNELLARADQAMYREKEARRAG